MEFGKLLKMQEITLSIPKSDVLSLGVINLKEIQVSHDFIKTYKYGYTVSTLAIDTKQDKYQRRKE